MSQRKVTTVTASDARQRLSELVKEVFRTQSRVLIEKGGIPVAAIVPLVDVRRLEHLDRREAALFDELRAASPGLEDDELMDEVAQVIREVRAEQHEARA